MRESIAGAFCICSCISILLAGCSSAPRTTTPVIIPADWGYQQNAIELHIKADRQLNLFQKKPHTLMLCIYHLRDPNSFNQLQDEKGGLEKLLECSRFDSSILYARRLVIQPGQEIRQTLDRSEGAKYLGMAAGYYTMQKDKVTRSLPFPVLEQLQDGVVLHVPQKLSLDVNLGPSQIQKVEDSAPVQKK